MFILLIVSSPSRNFYRCTGCFQSNINIACRNTQNAARKYHSLLKITNIKTIHSLINKGKYNLNITISRACEKWEPVRLAEKWFGEFFLSFSFKARNYYPSYHIGPDFSNWKFPALSENSLHDNVLQFNVIICCAKEARALIVVDWMSANSLAKLWKTAEL